MSSQTVYGPQLERGFTVDDIVDALAGPLNYVQRDMILKATVYSDAA
ncbi:hypothetical protein [Allofournierella massiliensis]|nr:hypothetical protein [Fournierella massiliensis]